jgi:hypothetical protein
MKKKHNRKGKHAPGEQFIMLPRNLLVHDDWYSLPAHARVIFINMCMRHYHEDRKRNTNNGYIGYGCAAGAKAANVSTPTAYRMLDSLREKGLIKLRKNGIFKEKESEGRAAEWEISIFSTRSRPATWAAGKNGRLHIETWILKSDAYRALSSLEKCVLIEMLRRRDGGNNGAIEFGGPEVGGARELTDILDCASGSCGVMRIGFCIIALALWLQTGGALAQAPGAGFLVCVKSMVDKSVAADGTLPNVVDERFPRRKATYQREITTACAKFIDLKRIGAVLYEGDEGKAAAYADGMFDAATFLIISAIIGQK